MLNVNIITNIIKWLVNGSSPSVGNVSDPELGQDIAVGKLGTQAEKDRRLRKK